MSSLVRELQSKALDANVPTTQLLRMAMVVAVKLNLFAFEKWVKSELNGYSNFSEVPSYRIMSGKLMANTIYRGWQPVITHHLEPEVARKLARFGFDYPIHEIENMANSHDKKSFIFSYSEEGEKALMKAMDYPAQPGCLFQQHQFQGIIGTVKNIVLEWSINLEKDGIVGDGLSFSNEERNRGLKGTEIINNYYVGDISHSQIQQATHQSTQTLNSTPLDLEALKNLMITLTNSLREIDVNKDQRSELEADIRTIENQISSPKPKHIVVRECLSSIRNILEGATGSLLAEIIKQITSFLT